MTYWKQVKLSRESAHGTSIECTCWIEAEFAHQNWLVSLEDQPADVWTVEEVYGTLSSEKLKEHIKAQRVFNKKAEAKNI